jgi:hypothetical protein
MTNLPSIKAAGSKKVITVVPVPKSTPKINTFTMKSLFTNNTTHYKPGSLASGGVGTVRNTGSKSKKT